MRPPAVMRTSSPVNAALCAPQTQSGRRWGGARAKSFLCPSPASPLLQLGSPGRTLRVPPNPESGHLRREASERGKTPGLLYLKNKHEMVVPGG